MYISGRVLRYGTIKPGFLMVCWKLFLLFEFVPSYIHKAGKQARHRLSCSILARN